MYKFSVSIAFGLFGFWLNFYPLSFGLGQNQANIFFGLVFPMLISLAWGWKYGLLSATLGMGCQTIRLLPENVWIAFISFSLFTIWIVWHGWCAKRKINRICANFYLAELPFRVLSTLILYLVLSWEYQINITTWIPEITSTSVSATFINIMAITQLMNAYFVLLIANALLNISIIRKILRLKNNRMNTDYIISAAILFGCVFWVADSILDYILFNGTENTFWEILILKISTHELYMRTIFLIACLGGSLLISKYIHKYQQSEERFRSLVESTNDWVWEMDKRGIYTYANSKVKNILGYEPEEVIGKTPYKLMSPKEIQRVGKIFQNLLETHQSFTALENLNLHKNGENIILETSGVPFYDANGELMGLRGTYRDVTRRKQAEKTLRESEAKWRSLVQNAPNNITELDIDGTILFTNHAMSGVTVEEMIGANLFDYIPVAQHSVLRQVIEQVLLTGKMDSYELAMIFHDGTVTWYSNRIGPIKEAGKIVRFLVIGTDITERKQAEDALQKSEERFRNLVENINDWFWEIDENNIFTYSSPLSRELLGYEPDELKGKSLLDLIPDEERENIKEILMFSAESQEPFIGMENIIIHKDGNQIFIDTSGTPIIDSENHFRGYRGIGRDITERKQVEETLIQAKRTLQARNIFNNTLVRSTTEAQLVSEICRLMVEIAGYRFSWVGFAEDDNNKTVQPVAQFGYEETYLESLDITWNDTEPSPAGTAIYTGKVALVQNIPKASDAEPWRTQVLKQGYASAIALPLLANQKAFGVLNICSSEPQAFDDAEIRLLQNLANDLAYGIMALREAQERRQAEETLRENERFLQGIFDAIQDGIRVLDRNLNVLRVNAGMEKMYHSDNSLVSQKAPHQKISPVFLDPCLKSIETGEVYSEVIPYPSLDNPIGWNEITTFPLKDDNGFVTGIIEYIKDITERKQAEIVLEEYNRTLETEVEERTLSVVENNALMYATLEATADGILVVSQENKVLLYNQQFMDMWQIPSAILKQQNHWNIAKFTSQQLKDPQQYIEGTQQVQKQADVEHYDILEFQDGRFYERYSKPYQLDAKIVGQVLSFRDITQRTQAQEALRTSENKYRSILAHTSQGYWLIDTTSKTVEVNDSLCQMLGYTQAEMLDKTPLEFVDEENQSILKAQMEQRHQTNQRSYEINLITKAGNSLPTWFNATTIRDDTSDLIASFAMITDLTERKRTEERLARAKEAAEAANRAKSEFLANMSHELRTPLNGILGFAQILKRDKSLNPQQQDAIRTIQQSGEHLLTLLNDILDMSKVEAGKMELNPKDFHFLHFLKGIADIIQIRAQQKAIEFLHQFSTDLPTAVHCDETRLRQVLINLLGNAVKFTDQGKVIFKVERVNQKIGFQVTDTGQGIAQDELEIIFQPFHQVGNYTHKSEGTGLGLPISKKLLEMMESTLSIQSTLGKGSTFWFELNLPEVSEWQPLEQLPSQTIKGYKGHPRRILIIDDKDANRSLLINLLAPLGFELLEAVNGQEGVTKALAKRPELILMDLIMPVMDGFEATRQIRQSAELHNVVIIAVSASAFQQHRQESTLAGCNDFIIKPVETDEILEKIRKTLKLEWILEAEPAQSQQPPSASAEQPLIAPPTKIANRLYKLAMQGNVGAIIEQANELEQTDEKFKPFATELLLLAEEFQVRKIRQFIKPYLENGE